MDPFRVRRFWKRGPSCRAELLWQIQFKGWWHLRSKRQSNATFLAPIVRQERLHGYQRSLMAADLKSAAS